MNVMWSSRLFRVSLFLENASILMIWGCFSIVSNVIRSNYCCRRHTMHGNMVFSRESIFPTPQQSGCLCVCIVRDYRRPRLQASETTGVRDYRRPRLQATGVQDYRRPRLQAPETTGIRDYRRPRLQASETKAGARRINKSKSKGSYNELHLE